MKKPDAPAKRNGIPISEKHANEAKRGYTPIRCESKHPGGTKKAVPCTNLVRCCALFRHKYVLAAKNWCSCWKIHGLVCILDWQFPFYGCFAKKMLNKS
jgi:hypothetical protein